MPATAFGRSMASASDARASHINETISASVFQYSITNLLPGMCYLCSLRASTSQGWGQTSTRLVWTHPDGLSVYLFIYLLSSNCWDMDYEVEIRCGPQKACHFLFFYDKFGKYRAIL